MHKNKHMAHFEFKRPTMQQWFNLLTKDEQELYKTRLDDRKIGFVLHLFADHEMASMIFMAFIDYTTSEFSDFFAKHNEFYEANLTVRNAV